MHKSQIFTVSSNMANDSFNLFVSIFVNFSINCLKENKNLNYYPSCFCHLTVKEKVFFVASSNAVNSGYDQGERCLSAVFFALLTCWHVQFSNNLPSFFLDKLTSIYRQNQSCKKIPNSQNSLKAASFSSVVVNIASSVQKVSYSKPLHNKSRFLNTMKSFLTFNVINE